MAIVTLQDLKIPTPFKRFSWKEMRTLNVGEMLLLNSNSPSIDLIHVITCAMDFNVNVQINVHIFYGRNMWLKQRICDICLLVK